VSRQEIAMQIMGLGLDYDTGAPLIAPQDEEAFAGRLQEALRRNADSLRRQAEVSIQGETFRSEVVRQVRDLGDPRAAGWTFLLNGNDPRHDELVAALGPLAEHRGMADPEAPLVFRGEPPGEWFDWLLGNYSPWAADRVPHYVLIVGGPEQVPFRFQSLLDSAAAVGRVAFDSLDDLKTYVGKVIRLEKAAAPVVARETVFFAPDAGPGDATYFSRRYMAEPLAEEVRSRCGLAAQELVAEDATKERLREALRGARPALVYTASHGMAAPGQALEVQKRVHGAICCQRPAKGARSEWLFTAEDVPPPGEPFLEGAVFFQFACFGYGTPAESDYMHWLGKPGLNAAADFVAALPRRLLGHPRGPVGFIGHTDTAWLHGFDDPASPYLLKRWHPRLAPFLEAVRLLLQVQPTGLALADLHKRYNVTNALLTNYYDAVRRGKPPSADDTVRLASTFITRSDAQNYMIFGDPAVRLRIPDV
jgi:hypothetical protein